MSRRISTALFLAIFQGVAPASAWSCSVCFGNSDSLLTKGMNAGVLFLLAVLVCVLAAFGAFFAYLWWRSNHPLELEMELETQE